MSEQSLEKGVRAALQVMESLPIMGAGTGETVTPKPRAGPEPGLQATESNGFIGLMAPLLAGVARLRHDPTAATGAGAADGLAEGVSRAAKPPLRPIFAAQLPQQRPLSAVQPLRLLLAVASPARPDVPRPLSAADATDRVPFFPADGVRSSEDIASPLRRSVLTAAMDEPDPANAFIREARTEPDARSEAPRVARFDSAASDLGALTPVAKLTDGATTTSSLVAKHAPLPVDQPAAFAQRLEQHLSIILTHQAQHARIAVSPPELGPVEARVMVVGDEANVQLIAPHATTRDALEDALPRLRSLFTDSGLALGCVGVFTETPKHRPDQDASRSDFEHGDAVTHAVPAESTDPVKTPIGLIDAYV